MSDRLKNRVGDVIVSVLASSAVDRGFEPNRVKPMTITESGVKYHKPNHTPLKPEIKLYFVHKFTYYDKLTGNYKDLCAS
jgi:hypothetical protein